MRLKNRLLAMLLLVCMVFSMLPAVALTASAADTTATWQLVTDLADITAGDSYLILTPTYKAYNGKVSNGHLQTDTTAAVLSGTTFTSVPAGAVEVTFESTGTDKVYLLKDANGKYITAKAAKTKNFDLVTSDTYGWKFTASGTNSFDAQYQASGKQAYFRAYSNSSFRSYGDKTGDPIYLAKKAASYTVTASASPAAGGTVTVSGNTITAVPNEGYRVTGTFVADNGIAVEYNGDNTFTFTATADGEVLIEFALKTTAVLTYSENGATHEEIAYVGDSVTLPAPQNVAPEAYTFMGWLPTNYATSDTAPTGLLRVGDSYTLPTEYCTLYAVYAKTGEGGGSGGWTETELSAIADGTRLVIVSSKGSSRRALSNDKGTSSAPSAVSVTASGTSLASDPAETIVWTLEKSAEGYRFKSRTNYLYCTNTNNGVRVGTNSNNVFTVDTSGYLKNKATSRFIGVYNNSDWRCYTSTGTNIDGQTFLYYAEQAGTSYTGYTTNPVVANSHTVTWHNADGSTFLTTSVKEGQTITAPSSSPVKSDEGETYYAFAGWAKTASATAPLADLGAMGTSDMDFYPVFTSGTYSYAAAIGGADSVRVGKTATLTATLTATPEKDVSGYAAEWQSDAPATVSVDNTGMLTGMAQGSATITVSFKNADGTVVATATKTVAVTEAASGGYTLMTKANTTDNDPNFDWSGDYIIAGRKSGYVVDVNDYQILTPAWGQTIGSKTYDFVVEDGKIGKAQNNASIASIDASGSGTLATAYSSGATANGSVIAMEKTGDTLVNGTPIFDRITDIDDGFAFTIEQVDDVNHYYTIRIKGTNYYLANSVTSETGNNEFGYVLDASTSDTKALWTISWHTGVKTVNGYQADVVNIQSVYSSNRSILFNTLDWGSPRPENARFRVYGNGAYKDGLNAGSYGSGTCYNLFLFGNPNPFRAQIYYTGEQITISNAGEIPYGKATATLTSALAPNIEDYPNWSQVGQPTWSIVEKNNAMTIDPSTGVLTTNGSASGTYALVQVSYVVHDELNNVDHTVSTQAKVVVGAPVATYSTVIYETASGADTEVQYTVYKTAGTTAAECVLPLDAYVVNDLTDENSKTGSVIKGGSAAWSVVNNTDAAETVSIGADGKLNYANVTKDSILTVTLTGLTGDGTAASKATYKVYVKWFSYTAQITHNGGTTGDFTVPFGSAAYPLGKLVRNAAGETAGSGFTVDETKLVWATNNPGATVTKNADGSASLNVSGLAAGTVITVYVSGMKATDTESGQTADVPRASVKVTVGEQSTDVVANNDTVIVDFDRPVTFNILANDTFTNTAPASVTLNGTASGFAVNADLTVTYTPDGFLDAAKSCTYTVTAANGKTASATITVKPASAVYYEDSNSAFGYVDGKHGAWTMLGTESVTAQTSSLTAADIVEYDANYDGVYAQYSAGSIHRVNVTKDETQPSASVKNPLVEFDFAGTGFDVVSVTSNNTGAFMVQVTNAAGKSVVNKVISTYRGYEYVKNGFESVAYQETIRCDRDGTENASGAYSKLIIDANGGFEVRYEPEGFFVRSGEGYVAAADDAVAPFYVKRVETHYWRPVDDAATLDYYQIPVLKVNGLDYGLYHVKLTAAYSAAFDIREDGEYDFYFDAVRIHDPIQNESKLHYLSIRDAILEAGAFGSAMAQPCGHTGSSHWELGAKATYNASATLDGRGKLVEKCDICGNVMNTAYFYVTAMAATTALSTEAENDRSTLTYQIAVDSAAPAAAKTFFDALTFTEFWKSNNANIVNCYNNANVAYAAGAGTTYVTLQLTGSDGKVYASAIHTGDITVSGHTHVWGSSTVTTQPTCTATGVRTYRCTASRLDGTVCDKTKTEVVAALGHSYSGWTYDAEEHWHLCTRCNETADKAAHTLVYNETTDQDVCSVCGYTKAAGNTYTVTYLLQGESEDPAEEDSEEYKYVMATQQVTKGESITLLDPTTDEIFNGSLADCRHDVTFVGWTTHRTRTTELATEKPECMEARATFEPKGDTILYPLFEITVTKNSYGLAKDAPLSGQQVILTKAALDNSGRYDYYFLPCHMGSKCSSMLPTRSDGTWAVPFLESESSWTLKEATYGSYSGLALKCADGKYLHMNDTALELADGYANGTFEFISAGDGTYYVYSNQNGKWLACDAGGNENTTAGFRPVATKEEATPISTFVLADGVTVTTYATLPHNDVYTCEGTGGCLTFDIAMCACGQNWSTVTSNGSHNASVYVPLNAEQHNCVCRDCGTVVNAEAHTFDDNGACTACGYTKTGAAEGGTFTLITDADSITSGNYVLVIKAGGKYNGDYTYYALKKEHLSGSYVASQEADSFMGKGSAPSSISVSDNNIIFTVEGSSSGITLKNADGSAVVHNNSNSLYYGSGTATTWTPKLVAGTSTFTLSGSGSKYMGLRTDLGLSNGMPRFRCIGTATTDGSYYFYLYKQNTASAATSAVTGDASEVCAQPTVNADTAAVQSRPETRAVTPTDIVNGVTGSAIIDGMGSSFSMADFEKYGPKTEVYLAKNQAVVFYLENGKAGQDVQIGAKAVNGTAAGLTVITLKSSSAGGATQTLQKPLATATEMYYEIGADLTWDQGTSCAILVANTGDGVLTLTNLRSSAAVRMQINKDITDVARSIMTRVADGSMVYGADGYVTVVDSSPKPDPVEPTPNPVKPTPDPVEPTPDPVDPKPDPVEPTPDPVKPTPDPVEPKPMPKFTDLDEGAWYEAGVRYAVEAGLMRGTSETTFEPDGTLTRAMLVTVLYRLAGEPDVKTAHRFTDVPDGCWYSDAVAWAAETGLTNGVSETRFAPDEAVTREQMVTFLWRYAGQPDSRQSLEGFPDAQKVSGYARTALAWAVEHGVIGGNRVGSVNYLDPTEGATRAQIATIFMRSKNLLANE